VANTFVARSRTKHGASVRSGWSRRGHEHRRHVKVRGAANPYDPPWQLDFEERLATPMASTLTGRGTARYPWLEQGGTGLGRGQPLAREAGWVMHHLLWRGHDVGNLLLLHPSCH
jgi:RNA-directed DNA polymerase